VVGLLGGEKQIENTFACFNSIQERDRQTDGRIDGHRVTA